MEANNTKFFNSLNKLVNKGIDLKNDQISWQTPPDPLKLKINEIHVWKMELDCDVQVIHIMKKLLSREEQHRANRFRFEKHRNRFILSRGVLRLLIGRYLTVEPAHIQFRFQSHGKPYLSEKVKDRKLKFNLSHSHTLALYGFTWEHELGIDCEFMRPNIRLNSIAKRFFCSPEIDLIQKAPKSDKIDLFYIIWTRKEAYLKAIGKGLSSPLNHFDVVTKPGRIVQTEKSSDSQDSSLWKIHDIHVDDQYKAAVAVSTKDKILRQYSISPDLIT